MFVIYINNFIKNIRRTIADDMKIDGMLDGVMDYLMIQWGIDQLQNWAELRQMEFNLDKYEIMPPSQILVGQIAGSLGVLKY